MRADRWIRWQALVPRQFEYRIEYSRRGRLRFLGSSELSELLLGACERARIPVSTTGLVQPRPRVGYGPPLQAGVVGDREYIDLALDRKVDDLGLRIGSELPEQLRLRAVEFMPRCSPSMQLSRVALARYEADLDAGFYEQAASREQDSARVRQWSRRIEEGLSPEGNAPDDPINQVCAIRWNPVSEEIAQLEFTLDLRHEGVRCKPREVLSRALAGLSVDSRLVPLRRLRLLVADDSSGRAQLRTPLEQVLLARRQQRARERTWA
jgi:radical SAM-linked protein